MIIELKSLIPTIYEENQKETPSAAQQLLSLPEAELPLPHSSPVSAVPAMLPELAGSGTFQEMPSGENDQAASAALQDSSSRIADLLAQLLSVSERNAEFSNRIADLLEEQNSENNILYN